MPTLVELPNLPRVPVRLTATQHDIVRPGLLPIVIACVRSREGQFPRAEMPILFDPSLPTGTYEPTLAEKMIRLWSNAYPSFGSGRRARSALDFIDLSACALGVRATARQLRHGHIKLSGTRHALIRRRLLDLLEKARRRAMRRAQKELGPEVVGELQRRWHGFARWLSFYATSCRCGKPLVPGLRYRWRHFVIDSAVEVARKELAEIGVEAPAPRELRRLVRLAVSAVRRGRAGWGIRTLITKPEGGRYLQHFILQRTTNHQREQSL